MKQTIIVGTNSLLEAAHRLMLVGEISPRDYKDMCNRNKNIREEEKIDNIHIDMS